jgi:hypothetical protein
MIYTKLYMLVGKIHCGNDFSQIFYVASIEKEAFEEVNLCHKIVIDPSHRLG